MSGTWAYSTDNNSSTVWRGMCGASTSCTASSDSDTVWGTWIACGGTSANANTVWYVWSDDIAPQYISHRPRELTPEERERREQQRQEAEQHRQERERQRAEANQKAEELLQGVLTQEQREQLEAMAAFEVETERARYRIRRGRSGNVQELDVEGRVVARYCIHPREAVPDADTMLAQKLLLEVDEAAFLRIANRTSVRVQ